MPQGIVTYISPIDHRKESLHTTVEGSKLSLTRRTIAILLVAVISISALMGFFYGKRQGEFNASAIVSASGIGVYKDYLCASSLSSIDWGSLSPGSTKNIKVYVRNESNETRVLSISPANWLPSGANTKLNLNWKSTTVQMYPGQIANTTLSLYASKTISGISTFSFDIIIGSSAALAGDINHDGRVDLRDIQMIIYAIFSNPSSPNWNPNADLDENSIVDMRDLSIDLQSFGDTIA